MSGFFDFSNKDAKTRDPVCFLCGLYKGCKTPKMQYSGEGRKGILVVSEAPGRTEDDLGTQLVGESGKLLRDAMALEGIDLNRDCWKIHSVNCRPPGNRAPHDTELEYCNPLLHKCIEETKPKVILALGGTAMKALLWGRWEKKGGVGPVEMWRGRRIPDREFSAWIVPTYHPSYLLRSNRDDAYPTLFRNDIRMVAEAANIPFPHLTPEEDKIVLLHDTDEVNQLLAHISEAGTTIAFDYECTGLKPHADGHEIVCVAVATGPEKGYCFKLTEEVKPYWKTVLWNPKVAKYGANIKYESNWTHELLGVDIANWKWDTMVCEHILDNSRGATRLKFQAYVRFGVVDYSSEIEDALKDSKTGNGKNRVHDIPLKELMLYCGMDAMLTYRLAEMQIEELSNHPVLEEQES